MSERGDPAALEVGPERERRISAVLILSIYAVAGLVFLSPAYIRPDSVGVSAWLRSAVIDGDLLFFNEWRQFGLIVDGASMFKEVASSGALANHWWIGFSVMAAPFYLAAHLVTMAVGHVADGFFGNYGVVLAWTVVFAAAASALMMDRLVRRFVGESPFVRVVVQVSVLVGTPVFWYTFRFPIGTHVVALLFVALFLERLTAPDGGRWDIILSGIWLGLAALTRLQHLVLLLPAAWWLFSERDRWKREVGILTGVVGGVLVVQFAAWYAVYGHPLGPLVAGAAHGGATYLPFQKIRLVPVLFSWYHGLFTWSPVVLLSLVGCVAALRAERRTRTFAIAALLGFGAELAANGLMDRFFWGGFAFGSRRFLELAPLVGVGIGLFVKTFGRLVSGVLLLVSCGWSLALMIAALGGSLELARPVTFAMVFEAVLSPGKPMLPGRPALSLLLVGLILTAGVAGALALLLRSRKRAVAVLAGYLSVCAATLLLMTGPTRARAAEEAGRAGVDTRLSSEFGPLLDQRKLVTDEIIYLKQRGRNREAADGLREVEMIERRLRELRENDE